MNESGEVQGDLINSDASMSDEEPDDSDLIEPDGDSPNSETTEEEFSLCSKIIDHIHLSDQSEELSEDETIQIIEKSAEIDDTDFLDNSDSDRERSIEKIIKCLKNVCCFKALLPLSENPDIERDVHIRSA